MTATLLARTADLNFERHGFRFKQLTPTRWRISNAGGAVVGYLDDRAAAETTAAGPGQATINQSDRWSISRMTADRRGFVVLGAFVSAEEAIGALKWM